MKKSLLFAALISVLSVSCENTSTKTDDDLVIDIANDSVVSSFVFVGCNRLWWKDLDRNKSSANTDVLKNIFSHVAASSTKTDYFFFLGDIVNGENFTAKNVQFRDLRTEHGLFTFRYDPSYDGNIRKMYIILPSIKKVAYSHKQNEIVNEE